MPEIELVVDTVNANVDLGNYKSKFEITGDFNTWTNEHFVTQVDLKLSYIANPPKNYKLFYANFCSGFKPTLEIHVAVVNYVPDNNEIAYQSENPGVDFDLEPDTNKKVHVKFLVYDKAERIGDTHVVKCGNITSIQVPYAQEMKASYDASKLENASIDPQPDTANGNILVGKK